MKKLLLLALLAGCTAKEPTRTLEQQAIIKYVQHNEADSSRYVPLKFSKPQPFTQLDSVNNEQTAFRAEYERLDERRKDAQKILDQGVALRVPSSEMKRRQQEYQEASDATIALMERNTALLKRTTEAAIGQQVIHSWRVGERVDSAHFVLYKTGKVQRLK
jgi:hypothetical protein